jgi:MoxR-like ATPase
MDAADPVRPAAPRNAGAASTSPPPNPDAEAAAALLGALQSSIGQEVMGYEPVVRLLAIALVAEGHVLLEGVPGLAKTYLVRRFASSLALSFKRIQFTPDMLPSDIIGTVILNPATAAFEYRRGPVFANVVLADEINRAPPKVQSALLEAMQERQVTVDGITYPLPRPFIVIATQNPIEQEGTYPLPEAELDRLLFRILMDYPSPEAEVRILRTHGAMPEIPSRPPVVEPDAIARLHTAASRVEAKDDVIEYLSGVIRSTRDDQRILVGASPRAGVQFLRSAKVAALFSGRSYVIPEDVKSLAFWVLNHRLLLHPEVLAQQYSTDRRGVEGVLREIITDKLNKIAVPR